MSDGTENLDLHLTLLFGWLVRTVGSALLMATVIPIVLAIVAIATDEAGFIWAAAVVGPLVFALRLYTAAAPMPIGSDDD